MNSRECIQVFNACENTQKTLVVLLCLAKRSGVRFSRSGIIHTYLGGGEGGGGGGGRRVCVLK